MALPHVTEALKQRRGTHAWEEMCPIQVEDEGLIVDRKKRGLRGEGESVCVAGGGGGGID